MNKLLFLFLLLMLPFVANAQSNEPACNIGKSLSVMKQLFPELRYVKSDAKGDEYEDGYPEDGTAIFFYFKDEQVLKEIKNEASDNRPRGGTRPKTLSLHIKCARQKYAQNQNHQTKSRKK